MWNRLRRGTTPAFNLLDSCWCDQGSYNKWTYLSGKDSMQVCIESMKEGLNALVFDLHAHYFFTIMYINPIYPNPAIAARAVFPNPAVTARKNSNFSIFFEKNPPKSI